MSSLQSSEHMESKFCTRNNDEEDSMEITFPGI